MAQRQYFQKIRAVVESGAKSGKYRTTFASYGYFKGDDEKRTPVINPVAAAVVRRIFEMRATGCNMKHIAKVLNDEGILTPDDYRYSLQGITLPLTGLCYCADCGSKFKQVGSAKRKSTVTGYSCGQYARFGKKYCSSHFITAHALQDIVLADIKRQIDFVMNDDKAREKYLARKQGLYLEQHSDDKKKLRDISKRIAELDRLIASVYEDKVTGKMPEDMAFTLLDKYQTEKKSLQAESDEMQKRSDIAKQDEADVDEYIRRLKSYAGAEELTRQMALDLIEYVTIDANPRKKAIPRDIHIYYKLIDKPLKSKNNALA